MKSSYRFFVTTTLIALYLAACAKEGSTSTPNTESLSLTATAVAPFGNNDIPDDPWIIECGATNRYMHKLSGQEAKITAICGDGIVPALFIELGTGEQITIKHADGGWPTVRNFGTNSNLKIYGRSPSHNGFTVRPGEGWVAVDKEDEETLRNKELR